MPGVDIEMPVIGQVRVDGACSRPQWVHGIAEAS
jgi:hypothetical protein